MISRSRLADGSLGECFLQRFINEAQQQLIEPFAPPRFTSPSAETQPLMTSAPTEQAPRQLLSALPILRQ